MVVDPNDLPAGDMGCEGRAKSKRKTRTAEEPAAKRARGAKGKRQPAPEWEDGEECPVEELIDT